MLLMLLSILLAYVKDGQCNVSKDWLPSVVIDVTVVIVDIDSVLASEVKDGQGVGGDKV